MAYNQSQALERPIRKEAPRAARSDRTPERQVSLILGPRPETQQALLGPPIAFGYPLPPRNASFSSSNNPQKFMCYVDGCYEIRPHEHKDEGVFFDSFQQFLEDHNFRTFLDSINNNRAEFSHQASQIDNTVFLPVHRLNQYDPGTADTGLLNYQNESLEAFSAHLDRNDETEQEFIVDERTGCHFSLFRVGAPFPEPDQAGRNHPQIMYAGPAKPEQCTSPTCPIREVHGVGLYVHDGQWGLWPNETFGISNPPDHIWAAHARSLGNRASPEDLDMIQQFVIHHDRPYPGA